jgi:hypothetical protein
MSCVRAISAAGRVATTGVTAFGGDDPILGRPWYHAELTREASRAAGWDPAPSDDLAWYAVHIDMYCFDPTWRFRAIPGPATPRAWTARVAAVPRLRPPLTTLHFLDLFTAEQVGAAWLRITSGTLAGLAWAARDGDVCGARLLIGLSLHAMQDFYAHSTWVDDPGRRDLTWFAARDDQRAAGDVWSSGHFCSPPAGRSPHGRIRRRVSPEAAAPVRPGQIFGSRLAARFVELDPSAMTLDAPWMAAQTAVTRGFRPEEGQELFEAAYALALRTSEHWLRGLDGAMHAAGLGTFWRAVRTARLPRTARTAAFERPGAIAPYMASAGGRSGASENVDAAGRWFGVARLRLYGGASQVVRLGPWPALPDGVELAASRPAPVERAEVFAWQRPARDPDATVRVRAGLVHDSAREPRPIDRLRLPLDPAAVRELSVGR